MAVCGEEKIAGERGSIRDTCEYVYMYENQIDKKEMGKRERRKK